MRRGSFKRHIILTFGIGFFFMITPFVTGIVMAERTYLYRDSASHARSLTQALAVSSVSWVMASDLVGLQEIIHALETYPELRFAMVISNHGRVLAHTKVDNVGHFIADETSLRLLASTPRAVTLVDDDAVIDVAVPITFNEWNLGWARIRLGRGQLIDNVRRLIWGSGIFLASAFLLSLLAGQILSKRLGRRVSALASVADQVQSGQREVRADVKGNDEITQLARAFNDMLDNLADSEKRFRALFEQAAVGVAQVDTLNGSFVHINQRYCDIVGYTMEEMLALHFLDITHPDDIETCKHYLGLLISGKIREYSLEKRYCRKDGKVVWINMTASAMWGGGERPNYHVAVAQDITARVQAQDALLRLNQELEQRVKQETVKNREKDHMLIQQSRLAAMGEMVHNIAHQWRQPLNALGIIINNIQDDYTYGELTAEALNKAVIKSRNLLERMSTTVDEFRDFFRPDKEPCDFDLGGAVEDAIFIIGDSLTNNGITLEKRLAPGLLGHGHPNQFAQAVLNLLVNAKDAILERKIIGGKIDIGLLSMGNEAILTIEDNAGGIEEAVLPKIFDPYFTTKEQGSGIGLYMAKIIFERNIKGHIIATNHKDGALFTISIPLATGN